MIIFRLTSMKGGETLSGLPYEVRSNVKTFPGIFQDAFWNCRTPIYPSSASYS